MSEVPLYGGAVSHVRGTPVGGRFLRPMPCGRPEVEERRVSPQLAAAVQGYLAHKKTPTTIGPP
jgi:hypothetical protein